MCVVVYNGVVVVWCNGVLVYVGDFGVVCDSV